MNNLDDKLTIKIEDQEFQISFPNVGQYKLIQSNKARLSYGGYDSMNQVKNIEMDMALNLIDAQATFSVLIPDLEKKLTFNYNTLSMVKSKMITDAYLTQYYPWYSKLLKVINGIEDVAGE